MKKKELIRRLEELSTFSAQAQNDASDSLKTAKKIGHSHTIGYHEGREVVYGVVLTKVNTILEEAKE